MTSSFKIDVYTIFDRKQIELNTNFNNFYFSVLPQESQNLTFC